MFIEYKYYKVIDLRQFTIFTYTNGRWQKYTEYNILLYKFKYASWFSDVLVLFKSKLKL